MSAAAGKESTTSLSLLMEAYGQRENSPPWPLCTGQKELGREVQMWRQVRGPAGAVRCETNDLGTKWPHWHTLILEGDKRNDMIHVYPKDVRKMLWQQARAVYWKK